MSDRDQARSRWFWPASLVLVLAIGLLSIIGNTNFESPPRYDGAGYSVLALSIGSGQGYRSIDHPDAPRHTHFPPFYPFLLAGVWAVFGRSDLAAHLFSACCTLVAMGLGLRFFRCALPGRVAAIPALALAVNWTWGRVGGAIQSEPLFLLLTMASLCLVQAGRLSRFRSVALGALLGLSILTRHVGVCLAAAMLLELWIRGERRSVLVVAAILCLLVAPWIFWLGLSRGGSQLGLFESSGLVDRVLDQTLFYIRRIPDQIIGPIVESATVFGRSGLVAWGATIAAIAFTGVVLWGWGRSLGSSRLRVIAVYAALTLALLVVWPFTEAGRFLIPVVPLVIVGLAIGLAGQREGRRRALAFSLILAVSLPYAVYSILGQRAEAQRRTQRDLDDACSWIVEKGSRSGPILTRHPGEVFWQTGRKAVAPDSSVEQMIRTYGVAYLLVDDDRFANAPISPLGRFANEHSESVVLVRDGATKIYEVRGNAP